MTRAGHSNAQGRPFPLSTGIGRSEAILAPSEASPRPVPQLRSVASTHLTCVCPPASQVQGLEAKVDQLSAALAEAGGGGAGPGHIGKAIARTMGKRAVQLASTLSPSLSSDPSPLTPSPPHPSLQALLARGLRVDDQGGAGRTLDQLHQLLRTRSGTVELIDLRDPKQEVLQASSWAGTNLGQQITVTIKTLTGKSVHLKFSPLDTVRAGVVGLGLGLGLEQALGAWDLEVWS